MNDTLCPCCAGPMEPIPDIGFLCLNEMCRVHGARLGRLDIVLYEDGHLEVNAHGLGAFVVADIVQRVHEAAQKMRAEVLDGMIRTRQGAHRWN